MKNHGRESDQYLQVSQSLSWRVWLAEIDIESGQDFSIKTGNILKRKSCKLKCKIVDYSLMKKKVKRTSKRW